MSRIVRRQIKDVKLDTDGLPNEFTDQGDVRRVVELIDRWQEAGEWWNYEGQRRMYRVILDDGSTLDLERMEHPAPPDSPDPYTVRWYIYRVWD